MSAPGAAGLLLVGLSHRTAPLELRERSAVAPERLAACLASVATLEGVEECCILSTCNRTEVLVAGRPEARVEAALAALFFRDAGADQVYVHRGVQAVIHAFRVAAGLDSLVLGESQILAQVKAAFVAARSAGTLGRTLTPLFEQALSVGKRVRTETGVGAGTLSVARVAIDIAHRVFGGFGDCRALVVGAGETGLLVAQHLTDGGVGALTFANRSPERAREAADRFGAATAALGDLPRALARVDLVVACVDGGSNLVLAADFPKRLESRDRPFLAIDLSVPRAIEAEVASAPGLLYYDLDDLARVVERNRGERERAVEGTSEILLGEVHKYLALQSYAAAAPTIHALQERFDELRETTLDAVVGGSSTPDHVRLAHELTRRLLDASLTHLKDAFRRARDGSELDREYQRYLRGRAGREER